MNSQLQALRTFAITMLSILRATILQMKITLILGLCCLFIPAEIRIRIGVYQDNIGHNTKIIWQYTNKMYKSKEKGEKKHKFHHQYHFSLVDQKFQVHE